MSSRTNLSNTVRGCCKTCGDLRFGIQYQWPGDLSSDKDKTFTISAQAVELQSSADQGCTSCGLLVQSVNVFDKVSVLARSSVYGNPCRIDASSKRGGALRVKWDSPNNAQAKPMIEIFTEKGTEKAATNFVIGAANHLEPVLNCKQATTFIKSCLSTCMAEHSDCAKLDVSARPNRLLHVGTEQSTVFTGPYLVENLQECASYVALSYCWGTRPFRRVTRYTLA